MLVPAGHIVEAVYFMDLRRKLAYLHTAFAAFAVLAASATIYGVRLHVKNATDDFQSVIDQSNLIDHIRIATRDQLLSLYRIVDGRDEINPSFLSKRVAYFTQLKEITRFVRLRDVWPVYNHPC